jgi:hypothetical protein
VTEKSLIDAKLIIVTFFIYPNAQVPDMLSTFKILFPQTISAVEPIDEVLGLAIAAFFTAPECLLFQPFLDP